MTNYAGRVYTNSLKVKQFRFMSIIRKIQRALTDDLLKPKYRKLRPANAHRLWGHCYVAAEALFHYLGGYDSNWRAYCVRVSKDICHWWLENIVTGERLDPTADQLTAEEKRTLYKRGKRKGFLTREPSARAQIVLQEIGQ